MVPTLTLTLFTNIVHKNDIRMQCLAILTSDLTWSFWPEVRSPVELPVHVQMSMLHAHVHDAQTITNYFFDQQGAAGGGTPPTAWRISSG